MGKLTSPVWRYGGKGDIWPWIVSYLPRRGIARYIESFAGGANVLLNLSPPYPFEVYNDIDGELTTIFRTLRDHPEELYMKLHLTHHSRAEYIQAIDFNPNGVDDIEKARVWFLKHRQSFAGKSITATYGSWARSVKSAVKVKAWCNWIESMYWPIVERLRYVQIDAIDGIECIQKYDRPDTLHYCFLPDSKIRMRDEQLVPIEQVRKGDILFGNRRVTQKYQRDYAGTIFSIRAQGVPMPLRVTEKHPVLSIPKRPTGTRQDRRTSSQLQSQLKCVSAQSLQIGDYVLVPTGGYSQPVLWKFDNISRRRGKRKPTYFNVNKNNEHKLFRLLGFYAAEGYIHRSARNDHPYGAIFSWGLTENKFAHETVSYIKEIFGIEVELQREVPHDGVQQVQAYSASIGDFFHRYVPGQSRGDTKKRGLKRLHLALMTAPTDLQCALLRGWLDGDGGIYSTGRNGYKVTGTTVSKILAYQMYTIALRCGLRPSVKQRENNWDVYFSCVEDIASLGYSVQYKSARPTRRILDGYILSRITKINRVAYTGSVHNLRVSDDNLLCSSYIMTHNCDPPYHNDSRQGSDEYGHLELSSEYHERLLEVLLNTEGQIALSGYHVPVYDDLLKDWACVELEVQTSVPRRGRDKLASEGKRIECLWLNPALVANKPQQLSLFK